MESEPIFEEMLLETGVHCPLALCPLGWAPGFGLFAAQHHAAGEELLCVPSDLCLVEPTEHASSTSTMPWDYRLPQGLHSRLSIRGRNREVRHFAPHLNNLQGYSCFPSRL